jgi:hypothetical protein
LLEKLDDAGVDYVGVVLNMKTAKGNPADQKAYHASPTVV